MGRPTARLASIVLAALASACGTTNLDAEVGAPASSVGPQTTTIEAARLDPSTTTSSATTTLPEHTNGDQPSWDDRHVVIYGNYATDRSSAIRYLAASSDNVADLVDDSLTVLGFDLPFGVKVGNGQIIVSDGPNFPAPRVLWPVECLGVGPDVDGDALLDDCDPYPNDGPLADWDGDGVINPSDNCPTIVNPMQEAVGERSSGLACDPKEGLGPDTWAVVPTVTLDDWNLVRAERGLEPLVMPTGPAPLPPEVAAWCAAAFAEASAENGGLASLVRDVPDAFGLTVQQRDELVDLATRQASAFAEYQSLEQTDPSVLLETAGSLEQVTADFLAVAEEIGMLQAAMNPYLAAIADSDLACDLDR